MMMMDPTAQDDDALAALLHAWARETVALSAQQMRARTRRVAALVASSARDAARPLAAWATLVASSVRTSWTFRGHDAAAALHECVVAMEDVVMTAYHVLRERGSVAMSDDAKEKEEDDDDARLRGALAHILVVSAGTRAIDAWVDVALLLALCWVREGAALRARALLETPCHDRRAGWPLVFAHGLVAAVALRDEPHGLASLREAAMLADTDDHNGGDRRRGALGYWLAVLLSRAGEPKAAVEQLRVAVASNYHAVAALNLEALLAMQRGDLYEASRALERSVELDVGGDAVSLVNYAVLLEQMGSHDAQYQMLEYYVEATMSRDHEEENETTTPARKARTTASTANTGGDGGAISLFPEHETARLFACARRRVETEDVALQMAMAAMASGAWQVARERFEEYFAAVENARLVSQTTRRSFIYVLLQCNRPTEALAQCELSRDHEPDDLWVLFYKADALLCLERVDECEAQLKHEIEPRLASRLETAHHEHEELVSLHVQLLNNLAVVAVCRGDADAAVALLQDCTRRYGTRDDLLPTQFNLTLLLWRLERRDAACAVWFEARGWSLRMDVGDMREHHKALAFVVRAEDEALSSSSGWSREPIVSHVSDTASSGTSGAVDAQQLRFLDALVLNHWGNAQDSVVAKTAAQYVAYLEALSVKSAKVPVVNSGET